MSVVLLGSTSGSVTLQEPAVAGTTVLTLPAVTGTVLTTTSPKAGNVIQVVNATKLGQLEASFASATDLGLSASITPTSSSSKILVLVSAIGCCVRNNSSSNTWWHINLLRGSTSLIYFGDYIGINTSASIGPTPTFPNCCFLDSPATTSSTTYKIQGIRDSGTNNCIFNYQDSNFPAYSTMTLLEIAA
jgi:hypothetical protein